MSRGVFIVIVLAASLCSGTGFAQTAPAEAPPPGAPESAPPGTPAQDSTQPQNTPPDPFHGMIGAWEFSNADHDKICHFNFRSDPGVGGYRLDIDKNCPSLFPSTKDMAGWAVDNYGSLKLL